MTIKKAVALQEKNQVLVDIYKSQISEVSTQKEYHQLMLASDEIESSNTPQKDNTPKRARYTDSLSFD